jgi:hypothetical protein
MDSWIHHRPWLSKHFRGLWLALCVCSALEACPLWLADVGMSTPSFFCCCTIEVIIGPLFATTRPQCPRCHERAEGWVGVSGWVVSLASSPSLTSTHRCHSSLQLAHHLFDLAHGALRTPSTHTHTPTHTNTSATLFFCATLTHTPTTAVCVHSVVATRARRRFSRMKPFQIFIALLMVATGSINTIVTKMADLYCSNGLEIKT